MACSQIPRAQRPRNDTTVVTEDSVRGPAGRVAEPTNGTGEVSHNGAAVTPIYTCDETAQSYTRAQVKAGSGDRGPRPGPQREHTHVAFLVLTGCLLLATKNVPLGEVGRRVHGTL